jgi:hypothetical protein
MLGTILGGLIRLLGKNVLNSTLGYLESKSVQETERLRIAALYGSQVYLEAMKHRVFWIAWGIAAIPMASWFGWGMLDTMFNGALPDVAVIPPGLKPYADVVWSNIFWVGGGVASVGIVSRSLATIAQRIWK